MSPLALAKRPVPPRLANVRESILLNADYLSATLAVGAWGCDRKLLADPSISARACGTVIPGFIRATTCSQRSQRDERSSAFIVDSGIHRSTPSVRPRKPLGSAAAIVYSSLSTRIRFPTIVGSEPYFVKRPFLVLPPKRASQWRSRGKWSRTSLKQISAFSPSLTIARRCLAAR